MIVGSLRARLLVRESGSLKTKRQVVRSVRDRLRHDFNVSVAEVGARDHHQLVELGVAAVGTESREVRSVLDRIAHALRVHPVAELLNYEIDV